MSEREELKWSFLFRLTFRQGALFYPQGERFFLSE